jgi:hypothetical protein
MSEFYNLPAGVVHALIKHSFIQGSIFVPYDPLNILTDHLKSHKYTVTTNTDEEKLYDPIWWVGEKQKKYDWVIAPTLGSNAYNEYILEYGLQIAQCGLAVLDRLSFIEPVTKRKSFLLKNKLSNMIVFSPRPKFRAIGSTRDSVTACWFVFQKPENWTDGTQITYALNWDLTEPLPPLP